MTKLKIKKIIFIISLILIGCKSYQPFNNMNEKRNSLRILKKELKLSTKEFKLIKGKDSVLFEISNSIKNKVKSTLIKRRVDSFLLGNYSKQELLLCLKLDRISNGWSFEFDRSGKALNYPNFNNTKEVDAFLKKLERSLSIMNSVKVDSTRN
ncbi:hypothetical protein FBALC1_09232 [Flavobacteriales bacterium ALC-1]|nr:hypothetical protein FBALC1_09232 [Flavobacteriales bacterium ALC-1]